MGNEALEKIDISEEDKALFERSVQDDDAWRGSTKGGDGRSEQLLTATIEKITSEAALINLGGKSERRLDLAEITGKDGVLLFKEGDQIPVVVSGKPGERSRISYKKAVKRQKIAEFIAARKAEGEQAAPLDVEGVIVSKNKGGYVIESQGAEFFMPISLAAFKPDAKPQIGKSVTARLIKMDESSGSLVLSRRSYLNSLRKTRKEAIKKLSASDDVIEATVKRIQNYGMFVEANGVEGLVHYTEISHKGPINPAAHYKEGDKIFVKMVGYDKEKNRVSFSIKATQSNPWQEIAEQLEVGDTIKVTVANMEAYGAFVDLGNDTEGFLHISEMSWDKDLKHPSEILKLGEEIEVEVIALDIENQRLRVSLKNLQPKPYEEFIRKHKVGDRLKGIVSSLKDFGAFLKVEGVEGLLHNEECGWDRSETAKSLFKEGDEIEVELIKIDVANGRLSFSKKSLVESPIEAYAKKRQIGDIVQGVVRDAKEFGVFVRLEDGVDAMIRAEDLAPLKFEEIKVGDLIEASIAVMEPKKGRIRLSVRRLEKQKERDALKSFNGEEQRTTLGDAIRGTLKK
ncbi:MAG: S1 RNA-binding domain-containing protein [Helicobacteraceae bacterium]|jgi:small subunit ribosomal protein S1|nr:S1 RNA-binding domain-containing protein [Helicobacteraceae bacterium]